MIHVTEKKEDISAFGLRLVYDMTEKQLLKLKLLEIVYDNLNKKLKY